MTLTGHWDGDHIVKGLVAALSAAGGGGDMFVYSQLRVIKINVSTYCHVRFSGPVGGEAMVTSDIACWLDFPDNVKRL